MGDGAWSTFGMVMLLVPVDICCGVGWPINPLRNDGEWRRPSRAHFAKAELVKHEPTHPMRNVSVRTGGGYPPRHESETSMPQNLIDGRACIR